MQGSGFLTETPLLPGSVVGIGAFDGVHRGHQHLLGRLVREARRRKVPAVVYTFDPPPRVAFGGVPQLTPVAQKVERLQQCGIDLVIVAHFDAAYRQREAAWFVGELRRLHPLALHVGEDFRFGRGRQGDVELLRRHFQVCPLSSVRCSGGEVISSSRVRHLLTTGEHAAAQALLGWP